MGNYDSTEQLINYLHEIGKQYINSIQSNKRVWANPEFLQERTTFIGCTGEEIEELRQRQNVKRLPKVYINCMKVLGKQSGFIGIGSEITHHYVKVLKEEAAKMVIDSEVSFLLPSDAFVFFMSHSCMFKFFLTDNEDEDPPVFRYVETESEFYKETEHLSDWYEQELDVIRKAIIKNSSQ